MHSKKVILCCLAFFFYSYNLLLFAQDSLLKSEQYYKSIPDSLIPKYETITGNWMRGGLDWTTVLDIRKNGNEYDVEYENISSSPFKDSGKIKATFKDNVLSLKDTLVDSYRRKITRLYLITVVGSMFFVPEKEIDDFLHDLSEYKNNRHLIEVLNYLGYLYKDKL
jgi:hypothetical protein